MLASAGGIAFCLTAGMIANTFAAARGTFGKRKMNELKSSLSKPNLYAMMTAMSFFMLLPIMFYLEPNGVSALLADPVGRQNALISGILFYFYNEFSFRALGNLDSPVSHALANTTKRIVILLSSAYFMKEAMSTQFKIGASLAVGGVFLYSLANSYFTKPKSGKVA